MLITCGDIKPGDVLKTSGNQDLYVSDVIAVGLQHCVRRFSTDKTDAVKLLFSDGTSLVLPKSEGVEAEITADFREVRLHSVDAVLSRGP